MGRRHVTHTQTVWRSTRQNIAYTLCTRRHLLYAAGSYMQRVSVAPGSPWQRNRSRNQTPPAEIIAHPPSSTASLYISRASIRPKRINRVRDDLRPASSDGHEVSKSFSCPRTRPIHSGSSSCNKGATEQDKREKHRLLDLSSLCSALKKSNVWLAQRKYIISMAPSSTEKNQHLAKTCPFVYVR